MELRVRILIAEDDPTSRNLLTAVLKKRACDVVATGSGVEALRVMQQPDAPRLVILDWMMPGIDGLEVCRRIRETSKENPPYIIMLTTRGDTEDIITGLDAGADDYLVKPCNSNELNARVAVGQRIVALQDSLAEKVRELGAALSSIRTLQGILPICSFCKKILDDSEVWRQLEEYVSAHSEALFSHSVCPECMKEMYPKYAEQDGS
jgi:DNA-binding response OmpR family regulator